MANDYEEYPAPYGAGQAIRGESARQWGVVQGAAERARAGLAAESARQWNTVLAPAKQFSAGLLGQPMQGAAAANIPGAATAAADTDNPHPYPTYSRVADMERAALASPGVVQEGYHMPGNRQIVEANYSQYKDREAARAAQASQPVNYPGAMSALSMTNARVADGGDADAAAQRNVNIARAGGAGWLGLLTSGGAQRQLNAMRQHKLNQRKTSLDEARFGFDVNKYWEGEHPLAREELGLKGRQVGIEGSKLRLEEQKAAPTIWALNRINALRQAGRDEEADQLERSHLGRADEKLVVPGTAGGGTIVTAPGTARQTQQWISGMPPDWKPEK